MVAFTPPQGLHESLDRLARRARSGAEAQPFDPAVHHEDIHLIEQTILAILLRKLGGTTCDLWREVRSLGYGNGRIRGWLWLETLGERVPFERVPPDAVPLLLSWYAQLIRTVLLRERGHRCRCAERYGSVRPVLSAHMRKACGKYHWAGAYRPSGLRPEGSLQDDHVAHRFLRRAVDGFCDMRDDRVKGRPHLRDDGNSQRRAFAGSMLAAVLWTPGGQPLYLVKTRGVRDEFVEGPPDPGDGPADSEGLDGAVWRRWRRGRAAGGLHTDGTDVTVLMCRRCKVVLNAVDRVCEDPRCRWLVHRVSRDYVDPHGPPRTVRFYRCENGHLWPAGGESCPTCHTRNVRRKRCVLKPVIVPTKRGRD